MSWTQENISFSGNENITRTLEINRFAIVNKATLNLSGYLNVTNYLVNETLQNTSDLSPGCSQAQYLLINMSYYVGENQWYNLTKFHWALDDLTGVIAPDNGDAINLTVCSSNSMSNFTCLDTLANETNVSCIGTIATCGNEESVGVNRIMRWDNLNITTNASILFLTTKNNKAGTIECRINSTKPIPASIINTSLSGHIGTRDARMKLEWLELNNSYPLNPWIEIGTPDGTREWYFPGSFGQLNNITGDLSTAINNSLDFGSCDGGTRNEENCSIPFLFHSDRIGIIEYSDLQVNWSAPYITECASGNITFNVTKWKEENKAKTNGSLEATFTILGINYTYDIEDHHQDLFCLTPGYSQVPVDAIFEYTNDTNVVRTYYLNNATASNETQDIYLFLLETTNSTSVVINVIDENYNNMEDVFAKMQRYYVGTNTWETVEIGKTDTLGKAVLHVVVEDVFYKFIFEDKWGNVLDSTEPMKFVCLPTYEECKYTFQIAGDNINPFEPVAGLPGVSYNLEWDNDTSVVRFTWTDSTGTTQRGRLLVVKGHVTNESETICDTVLVANAGTISCDLSGENGTFYYYSYIHRSPGKLMGWGSISITALADMFGLEGVFWAVLIIITLFMIGIWNPVVAIIMGTVAFTFLTILGVLNIGISAVAYVVILAVLIIWRMRT